MLLASPLAKLMNLRATHTLGKGEHNAWQAISGRFWTGCRWICAP